MNHFNSIKNITTYGASQILNLLVPFLVGIYAIPIVGIANWGIIGVATSLYILLGIFIEFGSNLIGVKEISANKSNKEYVQQYISLTYSFRLYITIGLTLILLLLFLLLNVNYVYYFGLFWMLAWYYNPLWVYQAKEQFKVLNSIIIASKVLYLVLVFLLIRKQTDYVFLVGLLGLSNAIIYALFYYKLKVQFVSFKTAATLFKSNKEIVVSNFAITAYTQAPVFIIDAPAPLRPGSPRRSSRSGPRRDR